MKLVLLLTLATSAFSAPLTFSAQGSATAIPGGWFVDLLQANDFSSPSDRVAIFTASAPISSVEFYADNLPFQVGSGWIFFLDGVNVLNTGVLQLVQQNIALTLPHPFTVIRVETNYSPGLLERGNLLNFTTRDVPDVTPTPEPGTAALLVFLAVVLIFAWCLVKITEKLMPPNDKK